MLINFSFLGARYVHSSYGDGCYIVLYLGEEGESDSNGHRMAVDRWYRMLAVRGPQADLRLYLIPLPPSGMLPLPEEGGRIFDSRTAELQAGGCWRNHRPIGRKMAVGHRSV